jgi:large subunit ribosomal protein L21
MFAIVEIAAQQFEVRLNDVLNVPLLAGNSGDTLSFPNVLLVENQGQTTIGTPYTNGSVTATIVEHGRDEKVLVFKKKRRKGYQKLNGHRQKYTQIKITSINA